MKYLHVYALLLMSVLYSSCGQNQTYPPPDIIRSEAKDAVSSYGPSSMVRNVEQASNGDILIASFTGVWRYNGASFTNITTKISSPSFWDVLEDRKGNLWFGTRDSGVYCYNGKSFLHYTTRQGLPSNMALHFYQDRSGNIWFSCGGGASRYDGKSFRHFTTKDGLPKGGINTFMEDKNGKLWIGTRGEACFYDGEKFTVFSDAAGKTFNNVWAIIEDRKGSIWFGATIMHDRRSNGKGGDTLFISKGIWRYDGSSFTKVMPLGASAMIEDKQGNIWTTGEVNPNGVGAWKLLRYDQQSLYDKAPAVAEIMSGEKMLCRILEAKDGSIWFGSINGVYRYDGKTITDFKNKDGQQ